MAPAAAIEEPPAIVDFEARHIHKLFESEGTTFSKLVLGLRLTRVHRALSDPRYANLTIGAIACNAGFDDLSTFNREFRRHFGATPSDVRVATQKRQDFS